MNLQEFPDAIKDDIEDLSLQLLEEVKEDIIVIGGWGVRALLGDSHGRYTLDVDGVTSHDILSTIKKRFSSMGLQMNEVEWGVQFFKKYDPRVYTPERVNKVLEKVELRIEISGPKIYEYRTDHFFQFDLDNFVKKKINFHSKDDHILVKVPSMEYMTANKLGLPVDYKNNYDSAALLLKTDIDEVIEIIKMTDRWDEMVLRRIPKQIGRMKDTERVENLLARNNDLDIDEYVNKLEQIEERLNE